MDKSKSEKKQVHLITDGACIGNPGPGGWACILRYGPHNRKLSGGEQVIVLPGTSERTPQCLPVTAGDTGLFRISRLPSS